MAIKEDTRALLDQIAELPDARERIRAFDGIQAAASRLSGIERERLSIKTAQDLDAEAVEIRSNVLEPRANDIEAEVRELEARAKRKRAK